jgi:large subunit ribosomal protein L4
LKALKLNDTTCLLGTAGQDNTLYKSGRNIEGVEVLPASEFNVYTILKQKRLVLTRAALDQLRQGKTRPEAPAPEQK